MLERQYIRGSALACRNRADTQRTAQNQGCQIAESAGGSGELWSAGTVSRVRASKRPQNATHRRAEDLQKPRADRGAL